MTDTSISDLLQTAEVADLLGVPVRTIQRWTESYSFYLSDTAQPVDVAEERNQRFFSMRDVYILNTVRYYLRPDPGSVQPRRTSVYVRSVLDKAINDGELIEKLPGHEEPPVPPNFVYEGDVDSSASAQTIELVQDLTLTQDRLRVTLAEIGRLEEWLQREEGRADEAVQQRQQALVRLAQANRQVAELRVAIERGQTERERSRGEADRRAFTLQLRGLAFGAAIAFLFVGLLGFAGLAIYLTTISISGF